MGSQVLGGGHVDLTMNVNDFSTDVDKAIGKSDNLINKFAALGGAIGAAVAAIGGLAAIGGFGKSAIVAAGEFEQLQIAFEVMLGSADKAKALLSDLAEFAAVTPFELPGIVQSARTLLAFGFDAEDTIPILTGLGDIAAGTGAKLEELAAIYGKIKAAGKTSMEELRQFTLHGIPVVGELAKNLHKTNAEVYKMVTAGKVGFADVSKALGNLSGVGGKFHGLMEKQSQSVLGLFSTFSDSISAMMRAVGSSLIEGLNLKQLTQDATSFVESATPAIQEFITDGLAEIVPVVEAVVAVVEAVWPTVHGVLRIIGAGIAALWSGLADGFRMLGGWFFDLSDWLGITSEDVHGFSDAWAEVLTFLEVFVGEFPTVLANLGLIVAKFFVDQWDEIAYFFGTVIPSYLQYFYDNWENVWENVLDFTLTVFENLMTNAENFFTAFSSWISGDGFNFEWTGLLHGFRNTLKQMEPIAEKQQSELSKTLEGSIDVVQADFWGKFDALMKEREGKNHQVELKHTGGPTKGLGDFGGADAAAKAKDKKPAFVGLEEAANSFQLALLGADPAQRTADAAEATADATEEVAINTERTARAVEQMSKPQTAVYA